MVATSTTDADHIGVITFTEKAAAELSSRVRERLERLAVRLDLCDVDRQLVRKVLSLECETCQKEHCDVDVDEQQLKRVEAMVLSMTPGMRTLPSGLNLTTMCPFSFSSGNLASSRSFADLWSATHTLPSRST